MLPQEGSAVSESGRAVLGSTVLVDSSAVLVSGTAVGRASVADWVQQCCSWEVCQQCSWKDRHCCCQGHLWLVHVYWRGVQCWSQGWPHLLQAQQCWWVLAQWM